MDRDQQYNVILDYFELSKDHHARTVHHLDATQAGTQKQIAFLAQALEKLHALKKQLQEKDSIIAGQENQIEELISISKDLQKAQKNLDTKQEEQILASQKMSALKKEKESLEWRVAELEKERDTARGNCQKSQSLLHQAEGRLKAAEQDRMLREEHTLEMQDRQKKEFYQLKQESSKLEDIINDQNSEHYALKAQLQEMSDDLKRQDKKSSLLDQYEMNYYQAREQVDLKVKEITSLKQSIHSLEEEKFSLNHQLEDLSYQAKKEKGRFAKKLKKQQADQLQIEEAEDIQQKEILSLRDKVQEQGDWLTMKEAKIKKYSEELCKIQQRVLEVSEMSSNIIQENEQLKGQLKQIYSMYQSDKQYDQEVQDMKQALVTRRRQEMQRMTDTVDTLYQGKKSKRDY